VKTADLHAAPGDRSGPSFPGESAGSARRYTHAHRQRRRPDGSQRLIGFSPCISEVTGQRRPTGRWRKYEGDQAVSEWRSLREAIRRCHNRRHPQFDDYGGRGILVHAAWRDREAGYDAFMDHIGPKPSARHSLERKDNARGYEPGNVKWATRTEQNNNKRSNLLIKVDGVERTAAEWARVTGLCKRQTIPTRLRRGWDKRAAVLAPDGMTRREAHERFALRVAS
jgi:hypothetical protein